MKKRIPQTTKFEVRGGLTKKQNQILAIIFLFIAITSFIVFILSLIRLAEKGGL